MIYVRAMLIGATLGLAIMSPAYAVSIPTIDALEACDPANKAKPGYEAELQVLAAELAKHGQDLEAICKRVADREGEFPSPVSLPVHMMAQFYRLNPNQISAGVIHQNARYAQVGTVGPAGQRCTFELVRAPDELRAPTGWLMADSFCEQAGSGGMPTIDVGNLIKDR